MCDEQGSEELLQMLAQIPQEEYHVHISISLCSKICLRRARKPNFQADFYFNTLEINKNNYVRSY